jgi:hypothetical protein
MVNTLGGLFILGALSIWHLISHDLLVVLWGSIGTGVVCACVFFSLPLQSRWLNYYGACLGIAWIIVSVLSYSGQIVLLYCLYVGLCASIAGLYVNCSCRSSQAKTGLGTDDRQMWQRLCHSLMMCISSWLVLTVDGDSNWSEWRYGLAVILALWGILAYHGWQITIKDHTLYLYFYGIWGTQACYPLPLGQFNRLEAVTMMEAQDIQWWQLSGYSQEITLPLALELNPEEETAMRECGSLARHSCTRDSLELVHILLPQGAGIMAGFVLVALGAVVLWTWQGSMPAYLLFLLLLSVGLLSGYGARLILCLVSPAHLYPEPIARQWLFLPWEWGGLLAIGVFFLSYGEHLLDLGGLALGWLTLAWGVTLLSLVRRTPIGNKF